MTRELSPSPPSVVICIKALVRAKPRLAATCRQAGKNCSFTLSRHEHHQNSHIAVNMESALGLKSTAFPS